MTNKLNDKGFSSVVITVLLVIVIAVLGTAWYVMQQNETDSANSSPATNTNQSTEQTQPSVEELTQNQNGTFVGVAPKTGSGSVTLVHNENAASVVKLEDDFKVQEGPDLFIGFGNNDTLDKDTLFTELDAFEGEQEYTVSDTIDLSKYTQVFIYCKEFSATFSVATLVQ